MNIVLGVTGSISIYKSVEILRKFQKNGDDVSVIMTKSACKLISPIIFETFIPGKVHTEMFRERSDTLIHINIVKDNDLLSTTFIAWDKKVIVSPAMNTKMLNNPAVVNNLDRTP